MFEIGLYKRDKEGNRTFKCKHREIQFEDKARLKRHDRKAHYGYKTMLVGAEQRA
jgi:hypothetical protein